jgi:Protein of unknown function (DUF2934)
MTIKHEEISKRAREIWEREGRPEGRDKEHWLQAEAELRLESEKSQTQPSSLANHENSMMKASGDMNREGGNHKRTMRRGR